MLVDKYLQIRHICFDHHRARREKWDTAPSPYTQFVPARKYLERLEREVSQEDKQAPLNIEQALRYLSGVAVLGRSVEEPALFLLEPVCNSTCPSHIDPGTFDALLLKAHSLAAYVHYRRYLASPEAIPIDSDPFGEILRAAELANYAARKGFVSSAVVLAGFAFYCLLKQLGFKLEDISRFRPLWGALEEYMKTCEVMRLSSPYHPQVPGICAARHCGEKSLEDSCTRRVNRQRDDADCGFYCSVECQDQGWLQHQRLGVITTIPQRAFYQIALPASMDQHRLTDAHRRLRDLIAQGELR